MPSIMNAILSMDVYNRGYNQGVYGLSSEDGVTVGNFTLGETASNEVDRSSGFFAASYISDAGTVISYRGTDALFWSEEGGPFSWDGDVMRGWLIGGGEVNTPWVNQASLAVEFYEIATGRGVHDLESPSDVTVVGHSLGGGLAGFIASISGVDGFVFNHMPFTLAAHRQTDIDASDVGGLDYDLDDLGFRAPSLDNIEATVISGEILDLVRTYAPLGTGYLQFLGDFFLSGSPMLGFIEAAYNGISAGSAAADLEELVSENILLVPDSGLDSSDLHSMALTVAMEYGREEWGWEDWNGEPAAWRKGASFIFSNFMNDEIGNALGRISGGDQELATGNADAGDQMATLIAYTAIPEGEQPFGNVAIEAMFDDMTDLGLASLSLGDTSSWFNSFSNSLGEIAVNFAGRMAVGKVSVEDEDEDLAWDDEPGFPIDWEEPTAAFEGVISTETFFDYTTYEDTLASITVETSLATWNQGLFERSAEGLSDVERLVSRENRHIVGLDAIHYDIASTVESYGHSLAAEINGLYGLSPLDRVDSYVFVVGQGSYGVFIEEHDGLSLVSVQVDHAAVYGSSGSEIMVAWENGSTLYGMGGSDILIGSNNDDVLVGGGGSRILGGQGDDLITAEFGMTLDAFYGAHVDGGDGYDILSYEGAASVFVDAENSVVIIGDRTDVYSGVERIQGGFGDNQFVGNGQTQFEGSIGNDVFQLKVGDWARGASGLFGSGGAGNDLVSFEGMANGISMEAGGVVKNYNPGQTFSRINDVNVIVGTDYDDHFTGQNFDKSGDESLRFEGSSGNDYFELFNLNIANGGAGEDKFFIHLDYEETLVRIEDFKLEDALVVLFDGLSYELTGNQLSSSFEIRETSNGSYDLYELASGTSPFAASIADRYIGHYDADARIYMKTESQQTVESDGQWDFFEFDPSTDSGVLNLKIDGYGPLKVLFDDIDVADFGLSYETLPGSDGSRYDGQAFNHDDPTSSYHVEPVSFDDPLYDHLVSTTYIDDIALNFAVV